MNSAPPTAIVQRLFKNPEAVVGMAFFPSPTGACCCASGRFCPGLKHGSRQLRKRESRARRAPSPNERPFTTASLKRNTARLQNVYPATTSGRRQQVKRSAMKLKSTGTFAVFISFFAVSFAFAQDLGPQIRKLDDGVYVYVGKNFTTNCGIVLNQEGVGLIDSGHNPTDSRAILAAVRKLTPLPVRFLIDTEPHPDHTTGHFVFSPPAAVIAAEGAGDSMRSRERGDPERIQKLAAASPEMRAALDGYRFVTPHVEYHQKMALKVGERTFELMYLKGVHSESDTAVWLPKERVLFSAAGIVVDQINNLRPFVSIPDILAAAKTMKSLNPVHVVPGHGAPGTVKIFEESEKYYALLLERVGRLTKEGKSLDQIKKEVRMPEYENWAAQERFPTNVEAAYRAVIGG